MARSDLKAYRLYRSSGGGPPQRLAELERGTTTMHDKPPAGAVSVYTLTAVDPNGNESPPSGRGAQPPPRGGRLC